MSEAASSGWQRRIQPLDSIAASRWGAAALLLALSLACFLPGFFTVPAVDRDEARFAQTSKQMVESGNYIAPRLHEAPRYKKPIGIYWLQAAAAQISGFGADAPIWVYRLPSLAGACLAVLLTYAAGLILFGRHAALIAATLLASSVILGVEARLAKTDAVLLAATLAAQLALARCYLAPASTPVRIQWALLFWVATGVGVLVKGPILPMVGVLTAVALVVWERRAKWLLQLRPAIGVPLLLGIVLPWLVAITIQSDGAFLRQSVGGDLLAKVAAGQDLHGAPPGTHFLAFWAIFWPGAAFAAAAAPWVRRHLKAPAVRFCLAWILPTWFVFEVVATKLPHYTLPTYPAIALLVGAALASGHLAHPRSWARLLVASAAALGALAAIASAGALLWLENTLPLDTLLLAAAAVAGGALGAGRALRSGLESACLVLVVQATLLYACVFGTVAPRLEKVWLAPRLADAVAAHSSCDTPAVLAAGHREASLVFSVGTSIRFGDGAEAADFLAEGKCRAVILAAAERRRFEDRNAVLRRRAVAAETVSGLNIGNSLWLDIDVIVESEPLR